jgi:hypothetical protein
MMAALQAIQNFVEHYPATNWCVVAGAAALSWLAPIASAVAIVLGVLQIYLAIERRWGKNRRG